MAKAKTVVIKGVLRTVTSQTIQYKPFGYELDFTGQNGDDRVQVEFEIPEDGTIESERDGHVILNLDGFKAVLVTLANTLDEAAAEYKKKY